MNANEPLQTSPNGKRRRNIIIVSVAAVLLLGAGGAFAGWFFGCPCERTPGGYLLGEEVEEPVRDWRFANDVPLCQIQVRAPLLPHSVNLNCMATDNGELYLSCANCAGKRWSDAARENSAARLRLGEQVYPVRLSRVTDSAEKDRAWQARLEKLASLSSESDSASSRPRPPDDEWWAFRVVSRDQ